MWQADLVGRAGLSGADLNDVAADHPGAPIPAVDKQGDKTWRDARGRSVAWELKRAQAPQSTLGCLGGAMTAKPGRIAMIFESAALSGAGRSGAIRLVYGAVLPSIHAPVEMR